MQTQIQIPNPMATLYYKEHVHIAQTQTQIPIPYFCREQESECESVPESIFGNINEPLGKRNYYSLVKLFVHTGVKSVEVLKKPYTFFYRFFK